MKSLINKEKSIAAHVSEKVQGWPMIKRIVRDYIRPYLGQLCLAVFFMIIAAAMTAAFASMIEPVMDKVLVQGDLGVVWGLGLAICLIFSVRGVATYLETILMNKIGQNIVANIQNQMFSNFLDLDLRFFHIHPSGQLISRVTSDVDAMRNAVTGCLTGFGKSVITLILLLGVMFYQDPLLALATLTIFPPSALFVAWIGRRLRKMSGRIQESKAGLSDRLSQIFQGIRLVKAYAMESYERASTKKAIDYLKALIIKSVRIANLSTPVNETLVGFVVFGIIVYGGHQVAAGETTAGELMSFITAFTMSYEPMKKLARLNNTLQTGLGAAQRVFDMIDQRAEVISKEDARDIQFKKPEIVFNNIIFSYEGDNKMALKEISLSVPAGQVTALVGRSGSGKTTIMNLIPRFFDAQGGAIIIDGVDIRDLSLQGLRNNIALVSQDITIFDDTVWANIGYGKEGASHEEIVQAAIAAEADSFIQDLPERYDTKLGEKGVKLSGGQKQRISIARAILKDAPILLLDEATSALDNEAERAIQETLSTIQKGRTSLVIAHRLSTVREADQIIVLEDGEVVEQGRHDELLSQDGIYAKMYGAGLRE